MSETPTPASPKFRRCGDPWHWAVCLLLVTATLACVECLKTVNRAHIQRQAFLQLQPEDMKTWGHLPFPWYSAWLCKLLDYEYSYDLSFLYLSNFGTIDDNKMRAISCFKNLEEFSVGGGEILITDKGLEYMKGMTRLRLLQLYDSPVSQAAIDDLRRALPNCDVQWYPPEPVLDGDVEK